MDVLATDVGLWVMGSGQLHLNGSPKTSWLRAAGAISAGDTNIPLEASPSGWAVGDELSIAPTEAPTNSTYMTFDDRVVTGVGGLSVSINSGVSRTRPKVNNQWTAEVMNLTRNVRIEGTAAGKAHIFIRSDKPQTVRFVQIRYMGPRHLVNDENGTPVSSKIPGRYGLHFHHGMNGSRGSMVEGTVIRDTDNHAFVPHMSHGITMKDCVAYNVTETPYWWDIGEVSHDIVWEHDVAAKIKYVFHSLAENGDYNFGADGFRLGMGSGNVVRGSVVIGQPAMEASNIAGGFDWEADNEGIWVFENNMAHNNVTGSRVWQNTSNHHVINNLVAYHNLVTFLEAPLDGEVPVYMRNVTLRGQKKAAIHYAAGSDSVKSLDIINSNIAAPEFWLEPGINPLEVIRVQPASGQAYALRRVDQAGTLVPGWNARMSCIAPFAPTFWGTGTGLKGEYFDSTNFTGPSVTRIDANPMFQQFDGTVLPDFIQDMTYSVRWTGKVQPQYSESYTFSVGAGGGFRLSVGGRVVIDEFSEDHYPDTWKSAVTVPMVAGQLYDITLEFYNTDERSGVNLYWESPSLPKQYIPQSQLYPAQ